VLLSVLAAPRTATGLTVQSRLASTTDPAGLNVSAEEMASIHLQRDGFHGE
jgi:hypothetical protein